MHYVGRIGSKIINTSRSADRRGAQNLARPYEQFAWRASLYRRFAHTGVSDVRNSAYSGLNSDPTRCSRSAISGCEQVQQTTFLFDGLVGAIEQRRRHVEAERLAGSETDDRLILGRRLHWQVR